jgi:CobQ-like glutamine amidotransferase family enzyme
MNKALRVGHLFPKHLNLYGDRGNLIVLQKRCLWRGIDCTIDSIEDVGDLKLTELDFLFIGGGSDREQSLITDQLLRVKEELRAAFKEGLPCLAICGGYQFLGDYYQTAEGDKLKGLGFYDFYTISKPNRLIGNAVIENEKFGTIVGFENHGGRTYHRQQPLGIVRHGFGNNAEDKTEGIHVDQVIGTYLHGPLLPKNPVIADYFIQQMVVRKIGVHQLEKLDESYENAAKEVMINKLTKK